VAVMPIPTTGAVYCELRCNSDANKLNSVIYMLLRAAYCRLLNLHTVAPLLYAVWRWVFILLVTMCYTG